MLVKVVGVVVVEEDGAAIIEAGTSIVDGEIEASADKELVAVIEGLKDTVGNDEMLGDGVPDVDNVAVDETVADNVTDMVGDDV